MRRKEIINVTNAPKGSPYSIIERRVLELISLQVTLRKAAITFCQACSYPRKRLRGLLPISLFGEQRHDGWEQFA